MQTMFYLQLQLVCSALMILVSFEILICLIAILFLLIMMNLLSNNDVSLGQLY